MKKNALTVLALTAALFAGQVMAADTPAPQGPGGDRPHHDGMFERADANHDGVVTKDEFMKESASFFDKVDTNHDGKITKDEKEAFHQQMEQKREAWKAEHGDKFQGKATTGNTTGH